MVLKVQKIVTQYKWQVAKPEATNSVGVGRQVTFTVAFARSPNLRSSPWISKQKRDCLQSDPNAVLDDSFITVDTISITFTSGIINLQSKHNHTCESESCNCPIFRIMGLLFPYQWHNPCMLLHVLYLACKYFIFLPISELASVIKLNNSLP